MGSAYFYWRKPEGRANVVVYIRSAYTRRNWGIRGKSHMQILLSLGGMVLIILIAIGLSSNRKAIRPRVVVSAFALQAAIAALVL